MRVDLHLTGKSTLASYIVDKCINKCINGTSVGAPFKTIYFYCKAKVADASTCLAIFQGLLCQQLKHIQHNAKYRHLIAYCQDKKESSGRQRLDTHDVARSLLDLFFDVLPRQYIILDGLDECDNPEIKQCLALLTSVVSRQDHTEPGALRLLVVSRDISEIKKPLSLEGTTANIVKIQSTDNEQAIQKYVTQRLTEFPDQLKLTPAETEKIRDLICNKAKGAQGKSPNACTTRHSVLTKMTGMFLFAELVFNNLQRADSKAWLLKELEVRQFPRNLGEA